MKLKTILVNANGQVRAVDSPTQLGKLLETTANCHILTGSDLAWVQQVQKNLSTGYSYQEANMNSNELKEYVKRLNQQEQVQIEIRRQRALKRIQELRQQQKDKQNDHDVFETK
jgi:hypothetical protein